MFHLLYGHHPSSFPQSLVVIRSSEFACISHVLVAGYHQKEYLAADDARCRPRQEIHVFRLARPALSRNSLSFIFIRPREDRNLRHGVILHAGEEAGEYHVREN